MMGFGPLWMVALLFLPLVGLYYLLDAGRGRRSGPCAPPRSAVDAVRERYARGEIDRETYRRLIQDLEG